MCEWTFYAQLLDLAAFTALENQTALDDRCGVRDVESASPLIVCRHGPAKAGHGRTGIFGLADVKTAEHAASASPGRIRFFSHRRGTGCSRMASIRSLRLAKARL